jgi:hypothetical protein
VFFDFLGSIDVSLAHVELFGDGLLDTRCRAENAYLILERSYSSPELLSRELLMPLGFGGQQWLGFNIPKRMSQTRKAPHPIKDKGQFCFGF